MGYTSYKIKLNYFVLIDYGWPVYVNVLISLTTVNDYLLGKYEKLHLLGIFISV